MDGLELKILRVKANIRGKDLAQAMGYSPSNVSHIENRRLVPPEVVDRYVAAIATLTTNTTDDEEAIA